MTCNHRSKNTSLTFRPCDVNNPTNIYIHTLDCVWVECKWGTAHWCIPYEKCCLCACADHDNMYNFRRPIRTYYHQYTGSQNCTACLSNNPSDLWTGQSHETSCIILTAIYVLPVPNKSNTHQPAQQLVGGFELRDDYGLHGTFLLCSEIQFWLLNICFLVKMFNVSVALVKMFKVSVASKWKICHTVQNNPIINFKFK